MKGGTEKKIQAIIILGPESSNFIKLIYSTEESTMRRNYYLLLMRI